MWIGFLFRFDSSCDSIRLDLYTRFTVERKKSPSGYHFFLHSIAVSFVKPFTRRIRVGLLIMRNRRSTITINGEGASPRLPVESHRETRIGALGSHGRRVSFRQPIVDDLRPAILGHGLLNAINYGRLEPLIDPRSSREQLKWKRSRCSR